MAPSSPAFPTEALQLLAGFCRRGHFSVGRVGPPALHAAALEPALFASVTLRQCLESWSSVLSAPMATNQFENVVHGALKTYDLPDLLGTLPKAKVTVSDPLDLL